MKEFKVGDIIKKTIINKMLDDDTVNGYVIGRIKNLDYSNNRCRCDIEIIKWDRYMPYDLRGIYTDLNLSPDGCHKIEKLTEDELMVWLI